MNISVTITRQHIAAAEPRILCNPVTLALFDLEGVSQVKINRYGITVNGTLHRTPLKVRKLLIAWDRGQEVHPLTFKLKPIKVWGLK